MLKVTGRARRPASARSPLGVLPCSSRTHGGAVVGSMIAHCVPLILRSFVAGRCSGASNPLRLAFFHDAGRCSPRLPHAFESLT